jgi:diguanylate cyclase (GGDEF)-like protein/PAS domain S-box-containing protein
VDDKIINLIVIDDSFDSEEKIVSKLRTAGFTARSTRVEDVEDLNESLKSQEPDFIVYFEGMELISLRDTIKCLKENKNVDSTRVIQVNKTGLPDVVSAMRIGAIDATTFENIAHLILIIEREHQSLLNARQITKANKEFNESEKRCSSLLDSSRDAIAYIHEGMHVYSNQSYLEMFGINASDDLEGIPILDMVSNEVRDTFKTFLREHTKKNKDTEKLNTSLRKPNGEEFNGEMEFSSARIDGEPCIQIIIRKEDVNSDELERQLKLLSQKDQLTGLFNRQYCIEKLETTIVDAEQGTYTAALMEVHIDNFDEIKDTVGVVHSDQYIIEVAKVLNNTLHEGDVISRYTHDSFIIIAIDTAEKNIENYAAEIQKSVAHLETNIKGSVINTTCCVGITLIDSDSPEYHEVLSRSEKAVATAREKGTNQVIIHVPEKNELTRQEVDVKFKEQLTNALKNDKFVLHYQPIISLHGDTDERYEVFVRLAADDNDQLIMPQDFLPAAERIGMSIAIDRWVLFRTIKEFGKKQKEGITTRFFIKLSGPSIKDDTLMDWLSYQVKEKNIPANTLNFEIKESVAITNLKSAKSLSQKLKAIGCGFVLDDFGAGANPFQLLEHVDVDYIRMEKAFMNELADNPQNQETIRKITARATELGKFTIAQHVPDAGSLSILWGMGINFIQGYFLQEPLPEMEYDFTEMSG